MGKFHSNNILHIPASNSETITLYQKHFIFAAWGRAFPRKKRSEARECQITEMAGLRTTFPCVPTHFNPRLFCADCCSTGHK